MINIGELATKAGRVSPHSPALIDPQASVVRTFGELAERVDQLAYALRGRLDPGGGRRVAAISQNCVELFELYLGCAKAGVMLFPLNWRFSPAQVIEALTDSRPGIVFYHSEFASVVDEVRTSVEVDTWIEWSPGSSSEYESLLARTAQVSKVIQLPSPESVLHEPFLGISTGGTTGIPKSAIHTQFTYGACILDYLAAARINESDTYLMLGQMFHVVGYMALAYLAMGRPVVVAEFAADALLTIIEEQQVTSLFAIATMLPRLVNSAANSGRDVTSVRQVAYGGAPMGEEIVRSASTVFAADLIHAWGMTEFGPGTYLGPEAHRLALSGQRPDLLRSCGRPALFSDVAILDEHGEPVPRDGQTMGEVCHRGPNNMIGYWNKPEETADILRGGWIHSGDGGAWDTDGHIYIVDRMKSMLISGGENIFPSEIERTLGNHRDIAEVVVVGVPHADWGEVVKAVVVRRPGSELTADEVISYVATELASYKKPRIVEFRDELPMTPTGKVNRALLKTPDPAGSNVADAVADRS